MKRWPIAFTVAAFITVAAAGCDTPERSTAPDGASFDTNPTDTTTAPVTTESDTTGRGGGGFIGSGT